MLSLFMTYLDGLAPLLPLFYIMVQNSVVRKELAFLLLYLLSLFLFNTLADGLSFYTFSNYFVYHIELPVSFFFLLKFLKRNKQQIFYTEHFYKAGLFIIVLFIANSFLWEKINLFNSLSYSVCSFYILIVCLNYFWFKFNSDDKDDILTLPNFWFIAGLFIYHSSSFIVFFTYKIFIQTNDQLAWITWNFQSLMLLMMCVLIVIGIKQKLKCQIQ